MRLSLALFLILLLALPVHGDQARVYVLKVEGVIDPVASDYIVKGLERAASEGAEAVVIQLDTPGGLDASMRSSIIAILNAEVPVAVYVYPNGARAASAGSFILMASHVAAMAPSTNVGAAHPVDIAGTSASEKVTNDAAAFIRSLAERRGRNISLAESFVHNSTSISASEALRYGAIEVVAEDYPSLLEQLDGREVEVRGGKRALRTRGAELVELPMSRREELLHTISNPNIAYLLFLAGIYGIIFELANPGAILPGIIGGICILLALWAFQTISVSATGIALILFAVILFVAEVLSPTHGILTAGGIAALFLGSLLLLDPGKEPFLRISMGVILLATAITAAFFAFAVGLAIRTQRRRPTTGREAMVGATGVARENLDPEGQVMVHGELWRARAREGRIEKGKKIKVVEARELTLIVEEVR